MAFVLWLPNLFLGCLLINSLYGHVVFEISSDSDWHYPPGTSSDGRGGSLEYVAWVPATQRQEKLSVNNYLFIYLFELICVTII